MPARTPAGQFNGTVTIRRKATMQDPKGGIETLWQPLGVALPAKIECLDGREAMMAQALQGISNYRITLRGGADVQTTDQLILASGLELNISSRIDPVRRGGDVIVLATTESAGESPEAE